jgi:hypothetical protein
MSRPKDIKYISNDLLHEWAITRKFNYTMYETIVINTLIHLPSIRTIIDDRYSIWQDASEQGVKLLFSEKLEPPFDLCILELHEESRYGFKLDNYGRILWRKHDNTSMFNHDHFSETVLMSHTEKKRIVAQLVELCTILPDILLQIIVEYLYSTQ